MQIHCKCKVQSHCTCKMQSHYKIACKAIAKTPAKPRCCRRKATYANLVYIYTYISIKYVWIFFILEWALEGGVGFIGFRDPVFFISTTYQLILTHLDQIQLHEHNFSTFLYLQKTLEGLFGKSGSMVRFLNCVTPYGV